MNYFNAFYCIELFCYYYCLFVDYDGAWNALSDSVYGFDPKFDGLTIKIVFEEFKGECWVIDGFSDCIIEYYIFQELYI